MLLPPNPLVEFISFNDENGGSGCAHGIELSLTVCAQATTIGTDENMRDVGRDAFCCGNAPAETDDALRDILADCGIGFLHLLSCAVRGWDEGATKENGALAAGLHDANRRKQTKSKKTRHSASGGEWAEVQS